MTVAAPPRPPQRPQPVHDSEPDAPDALIEEARQRTRTRRRRYAALALAAAAALGLYFGLANGGGTSARPTDALASPPAATPVAANATYFELWFPRPSLDGCCVTFPTWRTAAQLGISPDEDIHTRRELSGPDENRRATDLLERVLTSLIAGPTPADRELLAERARDAGFPGWPNSWITDFSPSSQLLGVTLSNGIATIDIAFTGGFDPLSPEIASTGEFYYLDGPFNGPVHAYAQLVLTATQFPFVDGVLFKLDGQPLYAHIADDELVGRPVTRADYEGSRGDDVFSRQGPGT